nr:autotransporter domain-containing protein [uncultured Steroidobacter sp.]
MSRIESQSLHVAIKQVLRNATRTAPRSTASAVALLALSAAALSPHARAADYSAANETELREAIDEANAHPDASSTITLTGDITFATTTAFPALTKTITLNTNGFSLNGQSGINPGGGFTLSGGTLTVIGGGELRGGDSATVSNPSGGGVGASVISMANGSVSNAATITAGRGADNTNGPAGSGGIGVSITNGSLTNTGSITGGTGGDRLGGAGAGGGTGAFGVSVVDGSLTNNGTITGGTGGGGLVFGAGGAGAWLSGGSHVNNGIIRGGPAGGGTNASGPGVALMNGASLTNGASGLIEGAGLTTFANGVVLNAGTTLINHGTVHGTVNLNVAGSATVNNTGTVEGLPSQAAVVSTQFQAASLTVVNSGTLRPGAGQPNAITFSTHNNAVSILELQPGSVIEGNVVAGSTNANDTFRLGGDGEDTFDVSGLATKYQGFARFEKTGTSFWTLTGTGSGGPGGSAAISWWLLDGTISASSATQLGPSLNFSNGATLQNTAAFSYARPISLQAGGGVIDTQADLTITAQVGGTGSFTKRGAASLILTSNFITFNGGATIAEGTLQLGNGGTSGGFFVGTFGVTNNSALAFNRSNALTVGNLISGTGSVIQRGTGTTTLTGNNTYTGETRVDSGILRINGDQSAATGLVTVANGATLGGSGIIGGAVTVADGGHIAPGNSPGTLTMGSLTLSGGSVLDFELGEANAIAGTYNDLINVNGDLTLDGTLNVALSAGGTYGAGIYRLINYTGTLTDNGLELGLMPASSANYVQTSVANQVNLINTQGLVLNYWDGADHARNDGEIGGGSGLWQAGGNDNWTTADATINADYQDGAMVIFGGTGGTVTVDDSLGAISVSGMQFASDDYRVEGDAIALGAGANTVRVGDGTDAGAGFTAIIASALTGSGMLDKTDLGTLVLTGANDYTGGTTISSGTLQVGDGGTSGSLTGDITNNATLAFNRSDALTFDGVITGTGVTRQLGSGTTVLTGAGSTVSALDIRHGSLEVTSGASLSSNATTIAAGATLRNAGTFEGTAGDDTLTLGGTLIGAVSLLDGNDQVHIATGADFSQASFDGGAGTDTVELTTNDAATLSAATFSGFESLVKRGGGALTLEGALDGFSENVTIAAGSVNLRAAAVQTNEFRIESGTTLTGVGSFSGNLYSAGMVSPGNSPGVIHVAGNYAQDAGGVLISEILPTGTDLLDVAGTATLAGTHRVNVEYGLYLDGTTQTLLQAGGGITGDFDSIEMNTSALMSAERELSANALTVSFARQPFTSIADPNSGRGRFAAWLEEQISAGASTPAMTDYINSLLQQPTAEGVQALLGERGEPVSAASQNSVSILGAGFARTVFDRFTLTESVQCGQAEQGSSDALNCFWGHGLRQWGQTGGGSRFDWTSDGAQFGVDRSLWAHWTLGATFSYADTGIRDLAGGRNEVRSKMGGLYASYEPGRLSLGMTAFYSGNENSTRRNVMVGATRQQARADFDSDSYGLGVRLSYRLTDEAGPMVRPFVEAFYDHIEATNFRERNAGDGSLAGRVHARDGLRGTLGLQLAETFDGYGQVFRPSLSLGVTHQFEDARSTLDLQPFSGTSSFRTHGPALDRTAYIARASLNVSLGANASIAVGYGGEIAEDYTQHEGNLSFRVAW